MAEKKQEYEAQAEKVKVDDDSVTVRLARVIQLEPFNTLSIDLSVTSSKRDGETIKQAFDRVFEFVDEKLEEKVELVEG